MQWVARIRATPSPHLLDQAAHGPGGLVRVDVAELAPVDDDDPAEILLGPPDRVQELLLQLLAVLVQPGLGVDDPPRVDEVVRLQVFQLRAERAAGHDGRV